MVTTLGEILPQAARRFKDRTALIVEERQFSFRELDAMSNRVANGLAAVGIQPGDRVSLFGANSWEWLVSYYGIVKTGAVVNPLNTMLTADEVRFTVTDAGSRAVLAAADKADTLLPLKGVGNLTDLVFWGEAPVAGARMLNDWLQGASAEFTAPRRQPADLAAICYTSGTTGRPKGAMQSQRSVIGAAVGTALMSVRTAEDRLINALPLPHVYGSCASRHDHGRRADGLLLPARASRFRQVRSLEPVPLLGRRSNPARSQGAGIHRAHWLSGLRSLGHDRAGRRRDGESGVRT
jgi:long-chain acyl-CoA synthetase